MLFTGALLSAAAKQQRTQPIIIDPVSYTHLASAIQAGIFAFTLAISGLNQYSNQISELEKNTALSSEQIKQQANELVASIPDSATLLLRISMIALPLLLIVVSYLVYRKFYRIDDAMYSRIIQDLEQRAKRCV